MNDKELLELAAKAHGGLVYVEGMDWIHEDDAGNRGAWWNPLTSDGDALRLAVKLGLVVEIGYAHRGFIAVRTNTDNWQEFREAYGNCPYAATRRAIVRAAAAIGETK